MQLKVLPTARMSEKYRDAAIDVERRRVLITQFTGSEQEKDFTQPANCEGLGRIHHFQRSASDGWPENPLPIEPATRALGLEAADMIRAQVFQNAVCNWRCWYCFVDFKLLSANRRYSRWVTPSELTELYLAQRDRPPMIDLTGGQPDLTPEWIPWMMEELEDRGLEHEVYLWSDDNLSNDYFWQYLSDAELDLLATYEMYGRVCCFKGFNADSFSFNTLAAPELFERQFDLFHRLLDLGIDLFAYVTLTTPRHKNIADDVARFVDRLQSVNANLPLRTIPLEIQVFTPVIARMDDVKQRALRYQRIAIDAWNTELSNRFTSDQRSVSIVDVSLS